MVPWLISLLLSFPEESEKHRNSLRKKNQEAKYAEDEVARTAAEATKVRSSGFHPQDKVR